MISELDESIKQILIKEGGFDPNEVEVSFEIPNREWSAGISKPTLNCYLFDIRENRELRQAGQQVERAPNGSGMVRRRAPMRVDLTYLITAWTRQVEDEHRLLWHVLATMARFSTLPAEYRQGRLHDQALPVYTRIAQPDTVLKSPGEFWTALENQLKPSLSYVVTLALDPELIAAGPPVLTSLIGLRALQAVPGDDLISIGGMVTGDEGVPVAGVEVQLEGRRAMDITGADGRFILRVPARGRYTLVARSGTGAVRRELDIPAPNYDLNLSPAPEPRHSRKSRTRSGSSEGGGTD